MDKKTCKDCKKKFEAPSKARFPRRYCDACSKERKEAYKDIHLIRIEDC